MCRSIARPASSPCRGACDSMPSRSSALSGWRRRRKWGASPRSFRAPSAAISTTRISASAPSCICRFSMPGANSVGRRRPRLAGRRRSLRHRVETGLSATLRVTLQKSTGLDRPWAETPTHVITMAFDPDLDVAAQSAVREMIRLIERRAGLERGGRLFALQHRRRRACHATGEPAQRRARHAGKVAPAGRRLSATANGEGLRLAGVRCGSPARPVSSSA